MKLINEHINFERNQDPKKIMKIGIKQEIENWLASQNQYLRDPEEIENWYSEVLCKCIFYYGPQEYIDYCFERGADVHYHNEKALRNAILKFNYEGASELIKRGASYKKAKDGFGGTGRDEWLIWEFEEYCKQNNIKLNESIRFERKLDPKNSMGIGIFSKPKKEVEKLIADLMNDIIQKNSIIYLNEFYVGDVHLNTAVENYCSIELQVPIKSYSIGKDYSVKKHLKQILEQIGLKLKKELNPHYVGNVIVYIFEIEPLPLKESYNFERGQDPKIAMGTGILHNLKLGTILLCKKEIEPNLQSRTRATENFTIKPGNYFLIRKAKIKNGKINLNGSTYNLTPKRLMQIDANFVGGEFLYLTSTEFFEHFEIVKLNETYNFERGIDPKKAMGIGSVESLIRDIKNMPSAINVIEDDWIKVLKNTLTGKYIKILIPRYFARDQYAEELCGRIKNLNNPLIQHVRMDGNGDVLIKLK